jgi:hypothetical protein
MAYLILHDRLDIRTKYEGESNENLKLLIFFIPQFIEHKLYIMA